MDPNNIKEPSNDEVLRIAINMLFDKMFYRDAVEDAAAHIKFLNSKTIESENINEEDLAKENHIYSLARFTDFICGKESYENIIERCVNRVHDEYKKIGDKNFVQKLKEYHEMIETENEKEEMEWQKLEASQSKENYDWKQKEKECILDNREYLTYRYDEKIESLVNNIVYGSGLIDVNAKLKDLHERIYIKINDFKKLDYKNYLNSELYQMINIIKNLIRQSDCFAKKILDLESPDITANYLEQFHKLCDSVYELTKYMNDKRFNN